jgi:hypothetical protein
MVPLVEQELLTIPEHMSLHPFFFYSSKWVVHVAKLHVFTVFVPWCPLRFSRKTLSGSFLLPLVLSGLPVLFVIFVFICILVSNMISISDDVPEYLSLSTAFSGVRVAQSLISFCVMFCTSLFVLFLLTCFVSIFDLRFWLLLWYLQTFLIFYKA